MHYFGVQRRSSAWKKHSMDEREQQYNSNSDTTSSNIHTLESPATNSLHLTAATTSAPKYSSFWQETKAYTPRLSENNPEVFTNHKVCIQCRTHTDHRMSILWLMGSLTQGEQTAWFSGTVPVFGVLSLEMYPFYSTYKTPHKHTAETLTNIARWLAGQMCREQFHYQKVLKARWISLTRKNLT